MYPPPMFMPPPPKQRGFARAIFMTLATTIFGISLTLNVYLLLASGVMSGGGMRQTNVIDGDPTQKIAVLPINGPIFSEMSQRFDRWLTSAERDANVKAIVIEIDSPGGTVTASDEILNRIKRYKAEHPNTPIVVSMAGLAASGGYYVACGGDHLIAQPSTLTGSIGVILPQWNLSKLMNKWGVDETTIESTGATFKNAGSMFRAERPEERAYMQDIADKMFALFKDVVAKGRQGKLKRPMEEIANGKIFTAADAQALGLIDEIGYQDDAYDVAAKRAGLTKKMVVKYHTPETIFDVFSSKSSVAPPRSENGGGVTINGVNISARDLHELLTPRMMYLWRGQ
jgi:protease-4